MEFSSEMIVELVDSMGNDLSVVRAAKVSTQGLEAETNDVANKGLINFLMKNRHGTPFEHNSMTFLISAPIFVFREFHRHRVGWSYNEESGRYKQLDAKFYVPDDQRPLVQQGKPGHYEYVAGTEEQILNTHGNLVYAYTIAYDSYEILLKQNIAKEVARMCLPVATYSSMYATCNARSLMAFLSLRTKDKTSMFPSYPQREIEMVAVQMEILFAQIFPLTYLTFCENGRVSP